MNGVFPGTGKFMQEVMGNTLFKRFELDHPKLLCKKGGPSADIKEELFHGCWVFTAEFHQGLSRQFEDATRIERPS
jgi:hypothetical protein